MVESYEAQFNDKQSLALDILSPDCKVEQLLYGGGAFGGKTWLGCYWQIMRRLIHPRTRGLIGRSELKKLQLTTMLRFWEICGDIGMKPGIHYEYNGQLNIITWHNGSETILLDMADKPRDPEFEGFGSFELTDYFIDEASEISKKAFDIIDSRVRYNLVNGIPKGLLTCNPNHGFTYAEFWQPWKADKLPPHRAFVEALLKDNTIAPDPVYEAKLMRLPESDRKRLLDGDWDYDDSPDIICNYDALVQMFNSTQPEPGSKNYITCDPAAMGKDRTTIGIWKGLHLVKVHEFTHKYPHEVADTLRHLAQDHSTSLSNVIVDSDGLGIGVKGLLKCRAFLNGSAAVKKEIYANRKAECYFKLGEYVNMNKIHINDLSKRDTIIKELDMVRETTGEDKKKTVTKKEEIKARHGISPDYADMIMMRMEFELIPNYGKYSWA